MLRGLVQDLMVIVSCLEGAHDTPYICFRLRYILLFLFFHLGSMADEMGMCHGPT